MDEAQTVKLIECPRDSWQGLPQIIPTHIKADYLRSLARAGFRHIDAVSFVSAAAVPQMTDSDEVLSALAEDGADAMKDVEIIAIVVNAKGVERALASPLVSTLGFPYSVSPTFLLRNQKQTPEESLDVLEEIEKRADDEGRDVVAYVSMAFGNPYGDAWSVGETVAACDLLVDMGVTRISIADTVGVATAEQVEEVAAAVLAEGAAAEIGVHLHARPADAATKIAAAYRAGCRRFDTALGGIGGCPFAQDVLVGNIATETAIQALKAAGAVLPELQSLETLQRAAQGIAARFGQPDVVH